MQKVEIRGECRSGGGDGDGGVEMKVGGGRWRVDV